MWCSAFHLLLPPRQLGVDGSTRASPRHLDLQQEASNFVWPGPLCPFICAWQIQPCHCFHRQHKGTLILALRSSYWQWEGDAPS